MLSLFFIVLIAIHANVVSAVTIDGSITGDGYGSPIAVQTVNTEFGDDLNNSDIFSPLKGSELDAAYARVEGSTLNIAFTGNLEDSFNKLVLFFDSIPGGQNILDTDTDNGGVNPLTDPSPFPSDPSMFAKMAGSSFDSGFGADYVMVLRHGFTGSENRFDVDFAVLGGATNQYLGVFNPVYTSDWNGNGSTGTGTANSAPIAVGLDNSNILGVVAGSSAANAADAAAVTTGIEVGLPLENIGNPTSDIKITAFITSSNHDFVSNQFLGGLPAPFGNIGSGQPGALFSLDNYSGDQCFVVVIPEPATFTYSSLCVLGLCLYRSRRKHN